MSSSSSSSSSWVKTRGGRSCCSGLYYCLGRWRCSSHGAWRAPSLSASNYREVTWFQHRGSSTAPVHSGDLCGPSPPRCVWQSGYPGRSLRGRISTIGRPERSAAERSCPRIQHFFFWGREADHTEPGYIFIRDDPRFQHGVKIRRPFRPFPPCCPERGEPELCLPHADSLGGRWVGRRDATHIYRSSVEVLLQKTNCFCEDFKGDLKRVRFIKLCFIQVVHFVLSTHGVCRVL